MQWLQLLIDVPRERSEILEDAIIECGAVSVTLEDAADQPIFAPGVGERPLWDNCTIKALFPATTDTDQIILQLSNAIQPAVTARWELLEDKDWTQEWKKYFQPLKCGDRLWICPSWIEAPEPDAINLSLDPGMAFGTGSHPTTHLCLRWLDKQDLVGKTIIDYGCGSGILGIAALLLGAEKVIAVDIDPQALLASRDNAQRNNIADDKLVTYLPDEVPTELRADVMLANILASPLIQLAPTISDLTAQGGILCLSGLLESQIDYVCAPYLQYFDFSAPAIESDWTQLSAQKVR
ncbi:MAG TPA: 50S ribosomal protein L11 methyltransferase [Porticoccaceae bacterium]|jgi:ribosomal protein L11 methyltransferase|nr:50S ribosomal protein L11 methyltransferase [Porticoccaceae bacterium]